MNREWGKIAVIYRDHVPAVDVAGLGLLDTDLEVVYVSEGRLARAPSRPRPDIRLVVYPLHAPPWLRREQLQNAFPAAVIVTCSEMPTADLAAVAQAHGYPLPLPEPIDGMQLQEWLGSPAPPPWSSDRSADASSLFEGRFSEFSQLFINLVEVSTNKEEFALVFGDLTKNIARRLNTEGCSFYLYSESEGRFCRGFLPLAGAYPTRADYYFRNAFLEDVINKGTPWVDNAFEGDLMDGSGRPITRRSVLWYPLIKNSKRIGVLEVVNKQDASGFNETDTEFLTPIMRTLAIVVENAILFQNVEQLCYTDDLTKLYNSRYLKQFLVTEVKRSLRYKKKLSLLFIDIDHFKSVNDAHGHLVGSETLVEAGRVLKAAVRDTDVVARYGGDEFVIVLPEVATERAVEIGERIRLKISKCHFGARQNLDIRLTVSIGVATCADHAMTAEGLIQKADIAMYQAKGFSKNTVCVAV